MASTYVPRTRPVVTSDHVREFLDYNTDTGEFTWRHRDARWFPDDRATRIWNTRYAGKPAGSLHRSGYVDIAVFHYPFRAHRLAWLYVHGEWPKQEVDHINGNRADNRLSNLRDVSPQTNQRNRPTPSNNTSGVQGVTFAKRENRWQAQISVSKRCIHLGHFDEYADAVRARKAAEAKYGFHENHGRRN